MQEGEVNFVWAFIDRYSARNPSARFKDSDLFDPVWLRVASVLYCTRTVHTSSYLRMWLGVQEHDEKEVRFSPSRILYLAISLLEAERN